MELVVIGSGAAYPERAGHASSSYLVRDGTAALLLDLGQGAFGGLVEEVEPSTLEAVAISHLHPDHFVDLVALRHYLRYEFEPPRRLPVYAAPGLSARLDGLFGEPGFTAAALDVETHQLGTRRIGPFSLEAKRVTHTADSHAFRVTRTVDPDAPGLVYSGDCGRADDLIDLIRPGDTLLTEVSFGPGPVPVDELHLDGDAVGRLAAGTRPARVLLTHLQMRRDRAQTVEHIRRGFAGPAILVEDGDRFPI
jgi:ribonuclease BN (tRNA processing enzyme)